MQEHSKSDEEMRALAASYTYQPWPQPVDQPAVAQAPADEYIEQSPAVEPCSRCYTYCDGDCSALRR